MNGFNPISDPSASEIAQAMRRIYDAGLTTTSGGNVSMRDETGRIRITPAGLDKGALNEKGIAAVEPDGRTGGGQRPSSELPIHRMIYETRPDLRAIIHAHPPGLVAFSICGRVPDTRILPAVHSACGVIGWAAYETTGSESLGKRVAQVFAQGHNVVVLENHGVVAGGTNLSQALHRFELAEHVAQTSIIAQMLGPLRPLAKEESTSEVERPSAEERPLIPSDSDETRKRCEQLLELSQRAARHRLACGRLARFSVRLAHEDDGHPGACFVISRATADWMALRRNDLTIEFLDHDSLDDSDARAHAAIYREHGEVGAIITAAPPHLSAFVVTGEALSTHTIPESYILLREVSMIGFEETADGPRSLASAVSPQRPSALVAGRGAVVVGRTPLEAFDRIEVFESTARSLIEARAIGEISAIAPARIEELARLFPI